MLKAGTVEISGTSRTKGAILFQVSLVVELFADQSSDYSTDQRRNPEQPKLRNRPIAYEQCLTGAPRRVNGRVRDGNGYKVDERQAQTNGNGRKPSRRFVAGCTQNDKQEHHSEYDFCDERCG